MLLTSQGKELDAINTFGIKNWINLNLDWSKLTNTINIRWLALMAMRINFYEEVVGSVQQRNERKLFFHKNWKKWEK